MARTWPLSVREVAGVPIAPPARLARWGTRLRGLLGGAHNRTGLPFQVLLERLLGALDAPALYACVELGVPDHLDVPRTATDLAPRVDARPEELERLLAYLASRGCIRRDRRGRYSKNGVTALLTHDTPWTGWVRFLGAPWATASYGKFGSALRDGADPIEVAHGVDFFAYLALHPDAAAAFHDAQAAGARLQAVMCAGAFPLDGVKAVLDVGGGTGTLLTHLLAAHQDMRGAILDLPAAGDGAAATFAEAGVTDRAEFVAGDFFTAVPEGYDLHVLTAVIHDWNDDDCARILTNCAAALAPGGRICVVETELEPGRLGSFVQATDALMLAFTPGGRERTAPEFAALWSRAGLRSMKETALPSGGTLFELAPR